MVLKVASICHLILLMCMISLISFSSVVHTPYPHAASVSLLFYRFGTKKSIYDIVGVNTNFVSPVTKPVAVLLKISLVVLRHMLRNCGILALAAIHSSMAGNTFTFVKYINSVFCYLHINLVPDILKRHVLLFFEGFMWYSNNACNCEVHVKGLRDFLHIL